MNWQAMSFDWNQMRAFLATAEEGSFSAAARVLRTTQPTIGRQIAALEASLGVTLVERSARGLALTQAGRDVLEHVLAMGEAATLISMAAARDSQDLTGEVTITASDLMAAAILPGRLDALRQAAPGLRLRIVSANDIRNLTRREADIAIRHVRPTQPDLIARHVGDDRANLYAAGAYLDRAGRPRTPRDVAALAFIGNPDPDPDRLMTALHDQGIPVTADAFVMTSDSFVAIWELVKAGHGIAMLPEVLGETTAGIEKVLPSLPSLTFPVWLVTHRELRTNRRIRVVFDHLAGALAGDEHAS